MKRILLILSTIFTVYVSAQDTIQATVSADSCYSIILENILNKDFIILDIRTDSEFSSGHIQNALQMNYYDNFSTNVDTLDRTKLYILHCQSGGRSAGAFSTMKSMGFIHLYEMQGGFNAWKNAGLPYTTETTTLNFAEINAVQAFTLYTNSVVFVDTRTVEDYNALHIPGAINIPFNSPNLETTLDTLNPETQYVFYCEAVSLCKTTSATQSIEQYLYTSSFKNINVLAGGIDAWINAGYTTYEIVGINNISDNLHIEINAVIYTLQTANKKSAIQIYNIRGQQIYCGTNHHFTLPKGIYIIKCENSSKKIIVN